MRLSERNERKKIWVPAVARKDAPGPLSQTHSFAAIEAAAVGGGLLSSPAPIKKTKRQAALLLSCGVCVCSFSHLVPLAAVPAGQLASDGGGKHVCQDWQRCPDARDSVSSGCDPACLVGSLYKVLSFSSAVFRLRGSRYP